MADRDTTFRLLIDDQGTPVLKAFGAEASRVLGIEKDVALAGKTIGREVAGGVAQAKPEVVKLAQATEAAGGAARDAGGRFVAAGGIIEKAMGTASREVGGFGRVAEMALGVSLGQIGVQAADRFRQGVTDAVGVGMTFEQQLADLSAITGIAGADLDSLGSAARDAALDTGVGASEQAEAFKLLASNIDVATMGGIGGLKAMGREVVTLSVAAGTDLALAADAVAGAINQFGLEADQASRVVNVLAAGAKAGAAEVPDLAAAMGAAGVTAAAAGVSIEATTGAIEILAQSTVKGAEAGTGLRNVLTIMQTETDKLAKYGITGLDVKTDGLSTTLKKLAPLLSNATGLADVFGRENLNVAQILIKGADAVDEMTAAVTGTNTAQDQAEVQMSTLRGSVTLLKTALEELALNGYDGLGGAAANLINGVRETVLWLDKNWDSVEAGTKILTLAAVAYGSYQAAALLSAAAAGAHTVATTAAGVAGIIMAGETGIATTAARAFNAAIAANPIGILLTGLGLAVGAWFLFGNSAEEAGEQAKTALAETRREVDELSASYRNLSDDALKAAEAMAQGRRRTAQSALRSADTEIASLRTQIAARPVTTTAGQNGGIAYDAERARMQARLDQLLADRIGLNSEINKQLGLESEAEAQISERAQAEATRTPPSSGAATDPTKKPKAPTGESPEARARRLEREREQQERDDQQAARDRAALEAQTSEQIIATRNAEAQNARDLDVNALRDVHRAFAERIALTEDEFARRRAALTNDEALREALRAKQAQDIETTADQAVAASNRAFGHEEDRIKEAKKVRDLSAAEIARLDAQLDAAKAKRDEDQLAAVRTRSTALAQVRQEDSDADRAAAGVRRQIDEDEAARDHQRFAERGEQINREMERAVAAVRAERDAKEKAHREQMQRVQEESDATLAAIGLAAQMMATVTANRRAALDAEYAAQTHRREAAQDAELAAMQARVDAERGVVDERTALEKQLDAAKVLVEKRRAADDLAYRKKSAEMDRKQAVADRAANLFRIAIETALNVVKAFPNPFKIAAAAALGVSQGVAVAGQPLPAIPQYALGTDRAPGGLALVGERGPELVHIPGGSSVITNERTERLGAAMRAVEQSQRATGAAQIVVQQVPDPAHAAALVAMRRETAGQTARLEAGLMGVERATREIDLRIDGLELSRGLKRVEAREAAAGNTRTR